MSWHGQINRTLWEIQQQVEKRPDMPRLRREFLRAHFLQRFEYDKAHHIPRDDRSFLFLHEQETPACLLLHGAQGTPAEMREMGNYLYQSGISVYCPRMSRLDAKERMVSWESWVTQAETALETMMTYSKNSFVIGLSLGGTIAMILSRTRGLAGVALLAPALVPRRTFKSRLLSIVRIITPTLFYRFAGWNGEILKAMDAAKKNAKRIRVPVLAIQAEDDNQLSPRGIKFIRRHARLRRNEIQMLPTGGHVLTRGPSRDEVFKRARDFVVRVSKVAVEGTGRPPASRNGEPVEPNDRPRDNANRGRGSRGRGRRRGRRGGDRGGDRGQDEVRDNKPSRSNSS